MQERTTKGQTRREKNKLRLRRGSTETAKSEQLMRLKDT